MKHLLRLLLLSPAPLMAQIMIDQYVVGEYRDDVVYEGVYYSPGNCTWADGTDFGFDFSGIAFPTGIELALVIDEPDPSGTTLMNGWQPVSVGDSTTFTPQTTGLEYQRQAALRPSISIYVRWAHRPLKARTTPAG
jgi:hypothetical protein